MPTFLPTRSGPPRRPTLQERQTAFHESEMQRMRFENRVATARAGVPASPGKSPETAARHAEFRDAPAEPPQTQAAPQRSIKDSPVFANVNFGGEQNEKAALGLLQFFESASGRPPQ